MRDKHTVSTGKQRMKHVRWLLVLYDFVIFLMASGLLLGVFQTKPLLSLSGVISQIVLGWACIFGARLVGNVYQQIWRYGGIQSYICLLISDACAFVLYCGLETILPVEHILFERLLAICCLSLLGSLSIRMVYRYAYKCCRKNSFFGRILGFLLVLFTGNKVQLEEESGKRKIKVAIIGAGRVGVGLAEELINSKTSLYLPKCFIDIQHEKIGRQIFGLDVLSEADATAKVLEAYGIQEVIFALPQIPMQKKKELFEYYKQMGCKVKVYDYPIVALAGGGKRRLREFDIEELLFRKPLEVVDEKTSAFYQGKTVLITGGGGSIGSELCRQIAKMKPGKLIILDIYENGAYDVQQELKMAYGDQLALYVEIVSICNRNGLEKVFAAYRPHIVINAAAHKHVPLMEHNCCEAVENNVFGTLNTVELSEQYGVQRMMMVSTDKAVNPTNVMGATKRMCEMIVQSHSDTSSATTFSVTRFGNVLGSAGSVIPLFKRQISNGGPLTVTDKRVIRYFMTIPEAAQLVLQSGAMAKNGELFVLDMGKPVKILELAESMIRLSGFEPYQDIDIIETGLRPGEKLYEELLVKTEELDKTENHLIFIERDASISYQSLQEKLSILRRALETGDDEVVKEALYRVVPTFRKPEEVNAQVSEAQMFQMQLSPQM